MEVYASGEGSCSGPRFASSSASSFPSIPTWLGHHLIQTFVPSPCSWDTLSQTLEPVGNQQLRQNGDHQQETARTIIQHTCEKLVHRFWRRKRAGRKPKPTVQEPTA